MTSTSAFSTDPGFLRALEGRLAAVDLAVPKAVLEKLERYYQLLAKWNATINLTALSLRGYPGATLDRLLVEPLVAAQFVQDGPRRWLDLGSGGGSPAIPLKIARHSLRLSMVESNQRRGAFLRECVRTQEFEDVNVLTIRIQDLPSALGSDKPELVTMRGVRLEADIAQVLNRIVRPGGRVFRFCSDAPSELSGFGPAEVRRLAAGRTLRVFEKL